MQALTDLALRPRPGAVPPHDLDAEGAVISTGIVKTDELDAIRIVLPRPEMFYSDANRYLVTAMYALADRGEPVDAVTVATWLRDAGRLLQVGGTPYIAQLIEKTPAVANVIAHAEIVRDKWRKRELIKICQYHAAHAYDAPESAEDLVHTVEVAIVELSSHVTSDVLERIDFAANDEITNLARARAAGHTMTGLSTGFGKLDALTSGLHAGDLYIVAGRPGMGKTSFATNMATNIARPAEVAAAFFSCEMPKSQLALRVLCAESGIDFAKTRMNMLTASDWQKLIDELGRLSGMPLFIDDTAAISLAQVRARTKKLQRDLASGRKGKAKKLGAVFIDYLQLMTGERERGQNRETEVSSLSRGLKQMAKDLEVAVVCLSQLNRAPEKRGASGPQQQGKGLGGKRPVLSDLRESGAIEQDADTVMFVYRDEYYDPDAHEGDSDVTIAKQRNGPMGPNIRADLRFKGPSMRFFEAAEKTYDDYAADFAENVEDL